MRKPGVCHSARRQKLHRKRLHRLLLADLAETNGSSAFSSVSQRFKIRSLSNSLSPPADRGLTNEIKYHDCRM